MQNGNSSTKRARMTSGRDTYCLPTLRRGRLRHISFSSGVIVKTGLFRLSPPASVPPLPHRLKQDDGSGDRNIKTSHVAKHWNTDHLVAPFPHEPSQPVTLSP